MMHTTTYSSSHSSIISLRTYSTFNDYSYCSFEKCPSICYCCCWSIPIDSCKLTIPTNPSYLYGLRQSTLIQCPPSRRFMLGSGDWYRARASIYDEGQYCCCVRQERVGRCIGMSCNLKCCVKEKRGIGVGKIKRGFRRNAVGDADAMLSLLSEVSVEECVVVREKRRGFSKEGSVVIEECKDRKRNDVIDEFKDRRPNVVIESVKGWRPNVESKNYRVESGGRVQGYKRNEEQESISKDEDGRLRRRESSSSYYSLSDSGVSESDVEVEIEKEQSVGESSTGQKESRKSGGVVISELTNQDWESYKDEKDQVLRSSQRNDSRVGSSIQQDWRKKSEKKLTEESVETNSRNVRQSQLSEAQQRSSEIASSSITQLNFQKEQLDMTSGRQSSSNFLKDNRASQYSKSSNHHEHSTQKNGENAESTSTAWRRSSQGEDSKVVGKSVQETGCEYCKTCGRNIENSKTQSDFQRHTEPIETSIDAKLTLNAGSLSKNRHREHEKISSSHQSSVEASKHHYQSHVLTGQANAERNPQHRLETILTDDVHAQSTSRENQQSEAQMRISVEKSKTSGESKSESRRRKEETSSSSLQVSAKEENNQHNETYLETSQVDARRNFQHDYGIMDTNASSSQSTVWSQLQSETRMKHLEESTASHIALEEVKKLRDESGGKVTKDIESSNTSHTEIGDSGVHDSKLELSSHSTSDKRVYNEQTYSKSKVKLVEELVEKRTRIDETIIQSTLRTEEQGPSTGYFPGDDTISQPSIPSRTGVQHFSGEEVRSGQLSITSPPYQDVSRSQFHEASSSSVKIDMGRTMETGSGSLYKHPQSITLSSHGEVYDSGTMSGEEYTPEDLLLSAARMQESSALIVGEILEQMSLEASTSETITEKKFEKLDSKHQDKIYMLQETSESDSDKTGSQKQGSVHPSRVSSSDSEKKELQKLDSKHSSSDSGTKGSSEQMWDVKDHFVHEASEMESLEGAASEGVGLARTGKSLWSAVARICRLRWGSRSENQKSPVKGKTSSSGSAGGESWFSGNEEGEAYGDGKKAGQLKLLQKTTSSDQSLLEATKSLKEVDVLMSLDANLSPVDVGASSSSRVLQSSSLSGDAAGGENTNLNVPQHMSLPSPSVDLSMPSVRQLRRTHSFEEIDGAEKYEVPISPSEEQRNDDADVGQTDGSASKETDADMKKRKLQRSKVVLQRFDEWEDAYRRDREQRKVDEIFMREALSEAMKAADSWEVPVGAVLVQNGKIIARGYNLVEELRDSTAHAEMLCIREASNVLRTWRLSETTLYVTLEPCPMCAGAILQARIGTLVWGAPNKLLGADGSWIRLFPVDMEGEQHSELTEKPAAPVHPFHPKMNIRRGILQEECSDIMQQFFQLRRKKAKEKAQKDTSSSDESGQPSCFPKPHHRSRLLHKMHNVFHPPKQ